ncbi:hypothetical protein, partial [Helicobacter sp. 11S03491-1]|uniref:hypothetical protein n=1 Tax=Helicobacter sp. 11S03491-1 TaxID=1476196 RepID=UPI001179C58A
MNKKKNVYSNDTIYVSTGDRTKTIHTKAMYPSKKSSLIVSAALCALTLPFSPVYSDAIIKTPFGDSTCSNTSTEACIGGSYEDLDSVSIKGYITLSDTFMPDEKSVFISGFARRDSKFTLNANKSILTTIKPTTAMTNGSSITMNFKDSAWEGDIVYSDRAYRRGKTSIFTFEGNYEGNSDDDLKGYAFVGTIGAYSGANTLNFDGANYKGDVWSNYDDNFGDGGRITINLKNKSNFEGYMENSGDYFNVTFTDSTMTGDITTTNTGSSSTKVPKTKVNFTNSTLNGNLINTAFFVGTIPTPEKFGTTAVFNGNGESGYAIIGDISTDVGLMDVTFNQANMKGNVDIITGNIDIWTQNNSYSSIITKLTFKNSELDGNIIQNIEFTGDDENKEYSMDYQTTVTFSGNGTNGYAMKDHSINLHNTGGVGGKGNISLDKGAKLEN